MIAYQKNVLKYLKEREKNFNGGKRNSQIGRMELPNRENGGKRNTRKK